MATKKEVLVVASTNPVKLATAAHAFNQVYNPETTGAFGGFFESIQQRVKEFWEPDVFQVIGHAAHSGVPAQPVGEVQTEAGAQARLHAIQLEYPNATAWVAIEGGVIINESSVVQIATILVAHKDCSRTFRVEAPRFEIPTSTARLVRAGAEVGPANDEVFGAKNSKEAGGMVGFVTDQLVLREDLYFVPLLIAFSQLKNAKRLYSQGL